MKVIRTRDIVGYTDPISALPGETLHIKASTVAPRFRSGMRRVDAVGWSARGATVEMSPAGGFAEVECDGAHHPVPLGSLARAPCPATLRSATTLTLGMIVKPTAKASRRQVLGYFHDTAGHPLGGVCIDDDGHAAITDQTASVLLRSGKRLVRGAWVALAATFASSTGTMQIAVASLHGAPEVVAGPGMLGGLFEARTITFAARLAGECPVEPFDGRMAEPLLAEADAVEVARALVSGLSGWRSLESSTLLAHWDFAVGMDEDRIIDTGPSRCDGTLLNTPTRAVTGPFWDGTVFDWRGRPEHYNAIHFHSDDLADCRWPDVASFKIPDDLASGLYTVALETETSTDFVPFVVRARREVRSPVALLLPTFTYLSYGNAPPAMRGPDFGIEPYPCEVAVEGHPDFGRSHYERYADGSPVMLSSRMRPLVSMRFGTRPWGLVPDGWLLTWLRSEVGQVDILTDEDLDREGLDALYGHRVIVTGNHPEYYSTAMLDALEAFCDRGGRMLYLGGNGFYWRVSVAARGPAMIEVRRTEDGTRAWIAEPGEGHHMMDGHYGGLWRRLGRPPNQLAGVGFAAQGFDESGHYQVLPGARTGPAAFALDGIGERFGQHGWLGGGAAGQEIDRADSRLAPGQDIHVLARSIGHPISMLRTKEEMLSNILPFEDRNARSDIAIRFAGASGAVFSVGSMAWVGALLDGGDGAGRNDVARMTANVLARFLDPTPFADR